MLTRPDVSAAALIDSPVGLGRPDNRQIPRPGVDHHGNLEDRISRDTLLTVVMLYWATGGVGTSFTTYFDYQHE